MKSKPQIRQSLGTLITALSVEDRCLASRDLCEKAVADPSILSAVSVGIFLSLHDEPDLRSAFESLLHLGINLALPYPGEDGTWAFHEITQVKTEEKGEWGLGFPQIGEWVPAKNLEVILVPGRGFTCEGDRIGRGKGIYDRLLAETNAKKIGVCFSCQIVDKLPVDEHDIRMDEVWGG